MFACPKCRKVYRNNGKWLMKHMVESCHTLTLKPIILLERNYDLNEIVCQVMSLLSSKGVKVEGILRIKQPMKFYRDEQKAYYGEVMAEMKAFFSNIVDFDYHDILIPVEGDF